MDQVHGTAGFDHSHRLGPDIRQQRRQKGDQQAKNPCHNLLGCGTIAQRSVASTTPHFRNVAL
jgi:hypothetical protein